MPIEGRVWKYGRDVDTDVIIPARYLVSTDPAELAKHCLEDLDPDFAARVSQGDIIVAGENFGCGSSREHAPLAIKGAGVSAVIAASFARIFYRNAINAGLPIFESEEAAGAIEKGHTVRADLASGEIRDLDTGRAFQAAPYPSELREIIEEGGLIAATRKKLASRSD